MRKLPRIAMLTTVLLAAVWGMAEAESGKVEGSCNNVASGFCNEFTGSAYKAVNVERSCNRQKMRFLAGVCPSEGRVGTCVIYRGKSNESFYRYYTSFPGYGIKPKNGVAAAAKDQCVNMKGEWVAE